MQRLLSLFCLMCIIPCSAMRTQQIFTKDKRNISQNGKKGQENCELSLVYSSITFSSLVTASNIAYLKQSGRIWQEAIKRSKLDTNQGLAHVFDYMYKDLGENILRCQISFDNANILLKNVTTSPWFQQAHQLYNLTSLNNLDSSYLSKQFASQLINTASLNALKEILPDLILPHNKLELLQFISCKNEESIVHKINFLSLNTHLEFSKAFGPISGLSLLYTYFYHQQKLGFFWKK